MFLINNENALKNVKCHFCYSAAMEEIMSLHVMAEPELHPICGNFVMHIHDELPQNLQEEIDSFGERFAKWYYVLDVAGYLLNSEEDSLCDLPVIIEQILEMPLIEFAYYMIGLSVSGLKISKKEFESWYPDVQRCLNELEERQYDLVKTETVVSILTQAEEVKQQLVHILQEYWDTAFGKEWEAISEYVKDIISHEEIALSHTTLSEYLAQFHSQLKMEDGCLVFDKTPRLVIEISKIESLLITPSIFGDNHLHGNIYGSRVNMLLNLNYRALQIHRSVPDSFFRFLQVLGDESRFKILKVLWNGDATTKEISDILRLAPSTISLHLKLLKEVDLVTSSKVKKFVYYRLKKDKLLTLEEQLLNYLKY